MYCSAVSFLIVFPFISSLRLILCDFALSFHGSLTVIVIVIQNFSNNADTNSSTYWAIPENIHTQPRTASMFYPPLAFGNSKMRYPPCPQNSIIVNPPSPSEFPFFWKYIFNLATPIWTNEHDFMPPQGCDLAAPGDKLSDPNLPLVDRLCKLLFRSEFGNKNQHH